ncbi:DL-glycerol-3-phosphatase [Teratosphaeriaceae sp. CCFEE 6253]|nr:DL-glycerol-3-phosphatase [Teratosphaeriaceae sp. CCFEE 6253]
MSSTPREDVYAAHAKDPALNLHQRLQHKTQASPPTPHDYTAGHDFSAPPQTHDCAALLFDMDGTIIDSTPAIVKYWHALGAAIGVPGATILETSHGRRSIDVLALLAPEKANWDFVCEAEARVPRDYGRDATEIPGARTLLERLEGEGVPWAIVTSGTKGLVGGWLDVMKLARPRVLVSAEEVAKGKPDPSCYRLGAKRLGLDDGSADIVVLEDAPAGVRAGKAAGYRVVALATTHAIEKLQEAGADWIVRDMRSVTLTRWDSKTDVASVEIENALVAS